MTRNLQTNMKGFLLQVTVFVNIFVTFSKSERDKSSSEIHDHNSVLCRSCGREVADPGLLRVSPLSPHFLERRNTSMFGSSLIVPVERLRNPAGFEFSVITFSQGGCQGVGDWTSDHTWYPGYSWRVSDM